ncbi:MAG: DUF4426 domain-containing protein [Gammaproteobacteria bacterium]|nr:DUF4426 domain-containing protein [Gammaproteobacteria bacterium]
MPTLRLSALISGVALLTLCAGSKAEQAWDCGDYLAHYSVLPSTLIGEMAARQQGIVRSPELLLITIAARTKQADHSGTHAISVSVRGHMTNLLEQVTVLAFKTVKESSAEYHLARLRADSNERLRFQIVIASEDDNAREQKICELVFRYHGNR